MTILNETPVSETIKAVINTLNGVTVSGRENMNRLLGSIVALEQIVGSIESAAATSGKEEE